MKYSIIIPYRNREEHLINLLPALHQHFKGKDYEIIVSEQDNNDPFQIAVVENIGFIHSTGETVIFNQVDYLPSDDVDYEVGFAPVLPAARALFLTRDADARGVLDIPAGYRNFSNGVDPRFYGGVICMKRHHFEEINGFNPMYRGWGNEDEDLRERFVWAGISVKRNEKGTFFVLYHEDNGKCSWGPEQPGYDVFMQGKMIYNNARKYSKIGYKNMSYTHTEEEKMGVRWIKSTNYKLTGPLMYPAGAI